MTYILTILLQMSVAGSLIYLLIALVRRAFGARISAGWYYRMSLLALFFMLVPCIIPMMPKVELPRVLPQMSAERSNEQLSSALADADALSNMVELADATVQRAQEPSVPVFTVDAAAIMSAIHIIWLLGCAAYVAKKLWDYTRFAKFLRRTSRLTRDANVLAALEQCRHETGISDGREVRIFTNRCISSPFMTGLRRCSIYLPERTIAPTELRMVLLHELTHIARHDIAYKSAAVLVRAIHWFNPLCVLLAKSVEEACEFSCDESVTKLLNRHEIKLYCHTILDMAAANAGKPLLSLGLSDKKILERRIICMINKRKINIKGIAISVILALMITASGIIVMSLGTSSDDKGAETPELTPQGQDEWIDESAEQVTSELSNDLDTVIISKDDIIDARVVNDPRTEDKGVPALLVRTKAEKDAAAERAYLVGLRDSMEYTMLTDSKLYMAFGAVTEEQANYVYNCVYAGDLLGIADDIKGMLLDDEKGTLYLTTDGGETVQIYMKEISDYSSDKLSQ